MAWWTFLRSYLAARWRFTHLRGDRLRRFQDARAQAIIAHARRHSPFYREHFAGWHGGDWRTLPTIDKAAMMAHFDRFTTLGLRRDEALAIALQAERAGEPAPRWRGLTLGLSSGTSGHRGLFVVNETERMTWAGTILARTLPGLPPRGYRVALFLRVPSRLYESVHGRWINLRFWDLMTPPEEAAPALAEFAPQVVIGPPSTLRRLAHLQRAGRLALAPRQLFSVAEVLEPQDETEIQSAFGVAVGQVYQCTEGLLAVSCPHGSLHIQEDLVALQLEPAPGAVDEPRWSPIVTDLWRRTQPIIRYRLNDIVALGAGRCACGSDFRILARIEGRCDDLCYVVRADGHLRPVVPDLVRRMILLADDRIEDYRVVQERPGQFHVMLQTRADPEAIGRAVRQCSEQLARHHGYQAPELVFVAQIEPPPRGAKLRRVIRTFPAPPSA